MCFVVQNQLNLYKIYFHTISKKNLFQSGNFGIGLIFFLGMGSWRPGTVFMEDYCYLHSMMLNAHESKFRTEWRI